MRRGLRQRRARHLRARARTRVYIYSVSSRGTVQSFSIGICCIYLLVSGSPLAVSSPPASPRISTVFHFAVYLVLYVFLSIGSTDVIVLGGLDGYGLRTILKHA